MTTCRLTLFATHYHELTRLTEMLPGCRNYKANVEEVGVRSCSCTGSRPALSPPPTASTWRSSPGCPPRSRTGR